MCFRASRAYRESKPGIIELKKIHRQRDEDFIFVLNRLRTGIADDTDLHLLNERRGDDTSEFGVTLATTNAIADRVNETQLDAIIERAHISLSEQSKEISQRSICQRHEP